MTLPALTWRYSANYNVTCAGANPTVLEAFTAIKDAFDAEDVIGDSLWTVSASSLSAAKSYIELKRKGSPGGTLGGFRLFLFGGSTSPASNVVHPSASYLTTQLYAGSALNRGTTDGPDADYTAAVPYDLTTYLYNKGCNWNTPGTFTTAASPRIVIMETDKCVTVLMVSNTHVAAITGGEIFERFSDGAAIYGVYGTGGTFDGGNLLIEVSDTVTASLAPVCNQGASFYPAGAYRRPSDSQQRCVGRYGGAFTNTVTSSYPGESPSNGYAILCPIVLSDRESTAANRVLEVFGVLRQIRVGPTLLGKRAIFDGTPTLRGYAVGKFSGTAGQAMIFDNTP